MKATKHLLVYYTFQLEETSEYNICKYTADYEQVSDIKIIHVLKYFPFDALSGNYHFRFKSEFKEQNENVVAWIDISNLESKVPLFNNAVYVKVLKIKNKAHNKLFTQQKLAKAAAGKSIIQPKPSQPVQPPKPKDKSPSPVPAAPRTLSPSPAPAKKPVQDPLFEVTIPNIATSSPDNRQKSPSTNATVNLMFDDGEVQSPKKPNSFDMTTTQKLQNFNQQIKDEQDQKERDMKARGELDDIIEKWAYTNKVRNNFRQLIVTVQSIWTYDGWTPITLSELLTDTDLKKYHNKAMLIFHPDKNRNVDYRRRYLSKRIASQLSESFRKL